MLKYSYAYIPRTRRCWGYRSFSVSGRTFGTRSLQAFGRKVPSPTSNHNWKLIFLSTLNSVWVTLICFFSIDAKTVMPYQNNLLILPAPGVSSWQIWCVTKGNLSLLFKCFLHSNLWVIHLSFFLYFYFGCEKQGAVVLSRCFTQHNITCLRFVHHLVQWLLILLFYFFFPFLFLFVSVSHRSCCSQPCLSLSPLHLLIEDKNKMFLAIQIGSLTVSSWTSPWL